jgi:glycine betaine/proline transport system substrate-binding protein
MVKPEKDCANPKVSSWTKSEVNTVVTSNFKKNASVALDFISNRVYPGDVMNGMLVFMTSQKASGKDAAFEFLEKHGDVWEKWVSPDVAKKVKASL